MERDPSFPTQVKDGNKDEADRKKDMKTDKMGALKLFFSHLQEGHVEFDPVTCPML